MLRIGHIEYANCTPIFASLLNNFSCANYQFVKGVPSRLNSMLRRGEIDLSPSSSIEYGKFPAKYYLLPNLSISAVGPVKSVLLFSRLPIEELNNQTIGLTTDSDTSVNLLKIILRKNYGFVNRFEHSTFSLQEALNSFSAILLIGDAALREGMRDNGLHVYDMGDLWDRFTGLPFVFALWIVTREAVEGKEAEVRSLCNELLEAKRLAYDSYEEIAAGCQEQGWIGREALVDYWRTISYELTPRHVEGVKTFFRYAADMGILADEPDIHIFS
ncbi:MAG: hypothetical protein FD174_2413 [Geobacteraceae bacterium]|nr:MAG: hypothetical protein FD174_2413 [Geobacteraceae bacterium]